MMNTAVTLLSIFFFSYSFAQIDPRAGMTYDKENMLYYKISNDQENLHIEIYKDEFARKVTMQGGIRMFFNPGGKRDTMNVPVVQYPLYKQLPRGYSYPIKWEELAAEHISGIPKGTMSVYNEYGILGEAELREVAGKKDFAKDGHVFTYKLSLPLQYVTSTEHKKIAIHIFFKGWRSVPFPPGASRGIAVGNVSQEQEAYGIELDTWTSSWIDYQLK